MQGDVAYSPLAAKQDGLRQAGLADKAKGQASGKVYKGANGQYVQLAREGEDAIWALLEQLARAKGRHSLCSAWWYASLFE
jgi:hypothetical protein